MSFTSVTEPQPSLAWQFESSNVDSVTNLQPSSQVSPGPAQLVGSAALVTNAPTSNTAVYFPGTTSTWMNLGTSTPINFDTSLSNIFMECWVYSSRSYNPNFITWHQGAAGGQENWSMYFGTDGSLITSIWGDVAGTVTQGGTGVGSAVGLNTWTHVGFAIANTASVYKTYIYVNGTPTAYTPPAGWVPKFYAAGTTQIGGRNYSPDLTNMYIRDLRVVQGGIVPTTSFTPGAAPFSYALPSYVTGSGSVVFTLLGQFVTYVPGKYNQALMIQNPDAVNQLNTYLSYPLTNSISVDAGVTISCWVQVRKTPSSNERYVYTFNRGSNNPGLYLAYNASNNFYVVLNNGTNAYVPSYPTISLNTWYNAIVVINNGTVSYYVNGTSYNAATYTPPSGVTLQTNFILGGSTNSAYEGNFIIDDLRIYNTALTSTQVASVYSSQGAPAPSRAMPQPQYAWDFNGTTAPYIGSATGTTTGTVSYNASGKYGQSLVIKNPTTGPTSANNINWITNSTFNMDSGFSVCFWLKVSTIPATDQSVIFYTNNSIIDYRYYISLGPSSTLSFVFYNNSTYLGPTAYTLSTNTWLHVVAQTVGGSMQFYINGTLFSSSAYAPSGCTLNAGLWLGGIANYGPTNAEYDDLRIFDRALTSIQVNDIYNQQGVPGRGVQTLAYPYDNVGITSSAAGLWSTRRLSSAYAGPVVNVRRNSDNAQLDFIADQFGNLSNVQSAVTIDSWLTSTTGNVTTWYDQFRSNNFTQATATSQPQIVKNSGKWVVFFNRDNLTGVPTFYSRMTIPNQISGIKTILYGINTIANTFETLLGQSGVDNAGFRMQGGDFFLGAYGNDRNDFLYTGGRDNRGNGFYLTYWYNNNKFGSSLNIVNDSNPLNQWGLVIGSTPGYTSFGFNSLSDGFSNRAFYGYLSEVAMFTDQISQVDAGSLYAAQYIARTSSTSLTGAPLFNQLSQAATSSAVGAFSLRAVNGVSTRAVQVRNGTTSATQDFYADERGNLLTAPVTGTTLQNWLGGATGYVTTWYDQSGRGNHMAQSTASLQPIISLATSPPSILFTGNGTTSGQYFQNTIPFTFNFGTNYQYTIRAVVNNTVGGVLVYKGKQGAPWNGNGEKAWYLGPSSLTSTSGNYPDLVGFAEGWVITSTPITSSKTSVTWASSSFSSVAVYENASSVTPSYTRASQLTDASNYLYFGITTASGVPYYNGNIYEIEIFSTPLSASDVTIMG